MALALGAFAVGVVLRPGLGQGRLPGKLKEGVAQGFETRGAPMSRAVVTTLIGHGCGAGQGLDTAPTRIAGAVIPPFRQQPGGQSFSSAWQARKDRAVSMGQKKGVDLLRVSRNLLHQR